MANQKIVKGPDKLLVEIGRSIMPKAIVISIVAHVVLTIFTSFSLFNDWRTYGIKAPSTINQIKSKAAKEAEAAKRKAEAEERANKLKAEAEAANATNGVSNASSPTNAAGKVSGKAGTNGVDKVGKDGAVRDENGKVKKAPEVQSLPPKQSFDYGEDLSLD